jgi:peptide chain release factor 2
MNETNIRVILHDLRFKTSRMSSAFVFFYARSRVSVYFFHSRSSDKKRIFDLRKYLAYFSIIKIQIAYFIDIMNMLNNFGQEYIYLSTKAVFIQNILNLILVKFYFIKKIDLNNAILTINPGQGGLDSQNFVKMLMKMYLKLFERFNFKARVTDLLNGENDGIKIVTIHITGEYAYGYFKSEIGVHRLLRNSQFNAQKKKDTRLSLLYG